MDDVNNMDDSMGVVDHESGGVSRRNMIKASVAAGALVWSAPVLLTGRAAADPADICCTDGTPVTVKIASMSGVTCQGNACLDERAADDPVNFESFSEGCPEFVNCINTLDLVIVENFRGNPGAATIRIVEGITLVSASAKTGSTCYFTDCPNLTTNANVGQFPNTCTGNQCQNISPIRVSFSGGDTIVTVAGISPLTIIQLTLCLSPEITGLC